MQKYTKGIKSTLKKFRLMKNDNIYFQAPLNIEQQTSIVAALNMRIPTLSQNLKDLQVIINFLSVLPRIERDNSLSEYMKTTFGREKISYLSDNIRLKHVRDVWLLIKYYQTDLLMKQNQVL